MESIFVSYSAKDISHVNSITSSANNYLSKSTDLWIATEKKDKVSRLRPGEDWRDEIKRNIEKSKGAVLLVSKNFLEAEIVKDFELPLIIEKKKSDPDYKIYPVLVENCDYEKNDFLNSKQFTNSPRTSLSSLTGKRYQLEIENLINNINIDFPEKKSRKMIYGLVASIILGFSLFLTLQSSSSNDLVENINNQNYIDFKELGVSNCFNIEDQTPFFATDLLDTNDSKETFLNPYYKITEKVNCDEDHVGQILSKNIILRETPGTLTLPSPIIGFYPKEECFYEQRDTPGLVKDCIGIVVDEIIPGTGAENSSLKSGDVIWQINGFSVTEFAELDLVIRNFEPDDYIVLSYDRYENSEIYSDKAIIKLSKNIITSDREVDIYAVARNYCSSEAQNYGIGFDPRSDSFASEYAEIPDEEIDRFLALPILDDEEILKDEILFHCAVFWFNPMTLNFFSDDMAIYPEDLTDLLFDVLYQSWDWDISSKKTYEDWFIEISYKYEIKEFIDIQNGDCFDIYKDIVKNNEASKKLFPIYPECNENGKVNAQFIGSYSFDLKSEKIIVNTDEFQEFINMQCREYSLDFAQNPIVAKSIFFEFFDLESESIQRPYATQAYWARTGDIIDVKCAFMSFDLIYDDVEVPLGVYSFTKFYDLFNPETTVVEKENKELTAGFLHCPENLFIGDGYFVGNNFKPYQGDRTDVGVIIGEWVKGDAEISSLTITSDSNGPVMIDYMGSGGYFPPAEGEEIFDFDEKYIVIPYPLISGDQPSAEQEEYDQYSHSVFIDFRNHPNLQRYISGAVPILLDLHPQYSGDLSLTFVVADTNNNIARSYCRTNVVSNPTIDLVIQTGKQGNIWSPDNLISTDFTYEPFDENTISFDRLNNIEIKGGTEEILIDFDIETGLNFFDESMRPTNIRIEMLICIFPNEPNCITKNTPKHSYQQYVDYISEDISYKENNGRIEYSNLPYNLYWENGVFKYRNIPMDYVSCKDSNENSGFQTKISQIDFECIEKSFNKIAVLLKEISYNSNWIGGQTTESNYCNISYRGFTPPNWESRLYPQGKSIVFNNYGYSNCGWDFPSNVNITNEFLFYVPLFEFSTITKMKLYEGIPFYYIYP